MEHGEERDSRKMTGNDDEFEDGMRRSCEWGRSAVKDNIERQREGGVVGSLEEQAKKAKGSWVAKVTI